MTLKDKIYMSDNTLEVSDTDDEEERELKQLLKSMEEKTKKRQPAHTNKKRPEVDKDNPLDLGRFPGIRKPEWLKNAEEGTHDDQQFEFIKAMRLFKTKNNRPFPTLSETLFVLKELGYQQVDKDTKLSKYLKANA